MAMTHKDYQAVAEVIHEETESRRDGTTGNLVARQIAYGLAEMFKSDNPHFDRQRFYRACGIED